MIVWVAIALPVLFLPIIGLAIDGGRLFDARRHLLDVADGAARAGAMHIVLGSRGEVRVDPRGATDDVHQYLDVAGIDRQQVSLDTISVERTASPRWQSLAVGVSQSTPTLFGPDGLEPGLSIAPLQPPATVNLPAASTLELAPQPVGSSSDFSDLLLMLLAGAAAAAAATAASSGTELARHMAGALQVLFAKQQPAQLSPEEQRALDDKDAGRPYDEEAYNRARQKLKQAEKYRGERNNRNGRAIEYGERVAGSCG